MPTNDTVSTHYTHGSLLEAIVDGIHKLGKTVDTVSVDDLGPVDEFHIGGRIATAHFLNQLAIGSGDHVLDVGCGLGGASRFVAQRYGARVTGIDLTSEYVATGEVMSSWAGLGERISLAQGDATAMSCSDGTFDKAFMMHVGMNIADKTALGRELYRVLRPGGTIGIFDIMRVAEGDLVFPVPWASSSQGSVVSSPEEYKAALTAAGFRIISVTNRGEFARAFFTDLQARTASAGGPPPLGLHILMGETAPTKISNMIENVARNIVVPVELIAQKIA